MASRFSKSLASVGAAVAMLVSSGAQAAMMTFDPLPPDFAEIVFYTEDGIIIRATTPGNHFHTVSGGVGDTEAQMFSVDGFPQLVDMAALSFRLASMDFADFFFSIEAVVTASSGAVEIINTPGTFFFGAGWQDITSFTITSQGFGAFNVDNITTTAATTAVSGPASLALLGIGFAALGFSLRKRSR